MARRCVAMTVGQGSTVHSDLDRMSRVELVAECMALRGKCAGKNTTIKELRKRYKDAEARTNAAVAEKNKSDRKCAQLAKKVENQQKALRATNDKNAELVEEMKGMVARFSKVTGDFAAMKKSERHYRAKAIGAKPNRKSSSKKAKKGASRKGASRKGASRKGAPRKPGRKREGGRGGANSIQGEPDEKYEVDALNCLDCGENLSGVVGEYTRRVSEIEEIRSKIVDYVVKKRWCRKCNKVVTPPVPNTVPGSPLSLQVHLLAVCLRMLGMSFGKILFIMSILLGIMHIGSRSTVRKMIRRIAKALGPAYKDLRDDLLREFNIHGDETGWRVDGRNEWLWAFIGKWVAYFVIDPSRGSAVPMRVLPGYGGNVTSDSWSAWNRVGKSHQKCHVHYVRWIDERLEFSRPSKEFKRFASTLKRILRDSQRDAKRRMSKADKAACVKRLEGRVERMIRKNYRDKNCKTMVKRLKREKGMLFTFILTGTDPDNNPAERPLRVPVSVRNMIGGNRTEEGAGDYAALLSIDTTSKMNGSNLYDYCMQRLGNAGKSTLKRIK